MTQPLQSRLEQLKRIGLSQHFRPAQKFKTEVFPSSHAERPSPPLKTFRCHVDFPKKLDANHGNLPPSGFYEFQNCYIGKSGTVTDENRIVLYGEDLTSSYWLLHLSKMIQKAAQTKFAANTLATGHFLNGAPDLIVDLPPQPGTLVNLMKPGPNIYGHWILDTLPMAFHFFEMARLGHFKRPFKFLLSSTTPQWARDFLQRLFKIGNDSLVIFDDDISVLHVERVITPSLMRVSPLISPRMNDFVAFVHSTLAVNFVKTIDRQTPRQFFISRRSFDAEKRNLVNITAIEQLIVSQGVEIVQPEQMPWRDQIRMFYNADIVIGEYGSGLHNTLFSQSSAIPIVLFNARSNLNQTSIAAIRKQDVIYVKPSREDLLPRNKTAYEIDLDDLSDALRVARAARALG